MLKFGRLIVTLAVCLVAAPTHAQTVSNTRRVFIDVPLGPVWDDARSESSRVSGATWGSGLAFGLDWGRSGIEFGVSVPQWHVMDLPMQRYQYAGQSFGWERQGAFYQSSSTVRRRSIDMTVMYRANTPVNRRITFSWLVGGGYVYRPEQFTSVTKEVLPDGSLVEANVMKRTSFRIYQAATARLDVELRVAPHVSVVPRLRITVFPSMLDDSSLAPRLLVARPEIAVRWGF